MAATGPGERPSSAYLVHSPSLAHHLHGARTIESTRLSTAQAAVAQREDVTAHNSQVAQRPIATVVAEQAVCDHEGRLHGGGVHFMPASESFVSPSQR